MGMEVMIYTDRYGNDLGALLDFDLDISWGETEQDFTLITNVRIEPGSYVYLDGTEIGGIIDSYTTSTETDLRTYKGRSWHGILSYKVLKPDAGRDYLTLTGDLNSIIDQIIRRAGLTSIFVASSEHARVSITWQCERYTDAYYELKKLMKASACKLMMKHANGKVELYAEPVNVISDEVDSDVMDFSIDTYHRVVNHLVCLGDGELRNRVVRHLYADAQGNISDTQTLFGIDEIEAVYDYNNADAAELIERGIEHLASMQSEGSVDVGTVDGGISAYVGDYIVARDNRNNAMVTAEVVQKIVKIQNGTMTVDYGVGSESNPMSRVIGGSAESTNSSAVYAAGPGIDITNNTISAEVTQSELDGVSSVASGAAARADSAYTLAESKSDFSGSYWDLAGIPSTFNPATHTHPATAITYGRSLPFTIVQNSYIGSTNGKSIPYNGWDETGFIDVTGVDKVYTNVTGQYNAWYKPDKTFLSGATFTANTGLAVPSGAKYLKLSQSHAIMSQLSVTTSAVTVDIAIDSLRASIPEAVTDSTVSEWGYIKGFTETDPTVPAWAKASSKPTYTAAEVGALPSSTVIPPEVTDATVGGWGYIKGYTETDPVFAASPAHGITAANITSWNGKYSKPSSGIPKTDLASAVQTSLGKADSSVQSVSVTQDVTTGTKIASIDVDGTTTDLYAPAGGGEGGPTYTLIWKGSAGPFTTQTLSESISHFDELEVTYADESRTWTEVINHGGASSFSTGLGSVFKGGATTTGTAAQYMYMLSIHVSFSDNTMSVNSNARTYVRNSSPYVVCERTNNANHVVLSVVGITRGIIDGTPSSGGSGGSHK